MTQYILILLIIICIIILIIKNSNYNKENFINENLISKCWIDVNKYPEAKIIFESKEIIKKELFNILSSNKWSIWSSDYTTTPIFTKMTDEEIIKRINQNMGKIGSKNKPSWRLFGLILNKKKLSENTKLCPETIKILNKFSDKILNAGFSLLEPKCYIGSHQDFDNRFYRLHIPLIIPKINNENKNIFITKDEINNTCVLQVENDFRLWKDNDYFIFDDTCIHNAWNNTNDIRIVLIVDILRVQ